MTTPTTDYYGAHAEPPLPPRRPRWRLWLSIGLIALALLVIGLISNRSTDTPAAAPRITREETPGVPSGVDPSTYQPNADAGPAIQQWTVDTPAPKAAPSGPLATFSDGTYEVGKGDGQVAPGRYKADGTSCYWARLSSSDESDVVPGGNHFGDGQTFVTVKKTDKYLKVSRCTYFKA